MFLENGLQVCDDFSQIKSEQPRFQIASGTILASEYPAKLQNYDKDAYLPKVDWRNLSLEELQLLKCTSAEIENKKNGEWVGIVGIPQNILDYFKELKELSKGDSIEPLRKSVEDNRYRSVIVTSSKWIQKTFSQDVTTSLEGGFIFIGGGNKVTLTYATGPRYIGLHVDSFYQVPLEERYLSPNRICINLGSGDRFLYFINLGLLRVFEKVKRANPSLISQIRIGSPLGLAFMRLFPDYPVIKLRISPGEAYIAPTENMIHDGSSLGNSHYDIHLTFRGNFYYKKEISL